MKKKGGGWKQVTEIHDAYLTKDSDIVDKQPILSNDRPLAINDSKDNSDGYQSKNEEERCSHEANAIHKQTTSSGDTNSKKKRKKSDKPQSSKYFFLCLYFDIVYVAHYFVIFSENFVLTLHSVSAKRLISACIVFFRPFHLFLLFIRFESDNDEFIETFSWYISWLIYLGKIVNAF